MPLSRDDDRASAPNPSADPVSAAPLRLAELLTASLCHDIAGPLGMIQNSLEMFAEDPEAPPAALTIASDAAGTLVRRLKLVRAAWSGGPGALDLAGLRGLASGLPGHDIRLDLSGLPPSAMIAAAPARILLNLLLLAAEALGGRGIIALAGDAERDIVVTIDGARAAWPQGLAAMLVDAAAAWACVAAETADGMRATQAALSALIAHESGLRVTMLLATAGPANAPLLLSCVPETTSGPRPGEP